MAGNFKRTKASADVAGPKSLDLAYNDRAGAFKMLGPILGKVSIMGALDTAKGVSQSGALVAVYNDAATTGYVLTGTATVVAPTSAANGIPCPPYQYTIIALGSDSHIRGSAGTLFGYEILDESAYAPSNS